ncbi:MAG: hypothetical protein IPI64_06415 [Chloracidobacterium sp.]|nr:hypothetical protein [Chloracidobacterium sp.]
MIRILISGILLSAFTSLAVGQIENVCTISSRTHPSNLSEGKKEKLKSTELARIAVIPNNEGPVHSRTVKIPNTPLYAYVQILFDDNMDFFDGLAPALNVEIVLSSRRNATERSTITSTFAQLAIDNYFKGDVWLHGKWHGETVAVSVLCVGPKPTNE